jgi:hypothetical protein
MYFISAAVIFLASHALLVQVSLPYNIGRAYLAGKLPSAIHWFDMRQGPVTHSMQSRESIQNKKIVIFLLINFIIMNLHEYGLYRHVSA